MPLESYDADMILDVVLYEDLHETSWRFETLRLLQ